MLRQASTLALTAAVAASCGCGTIGNVLGERHRGPRVYGGACREWGLIARPVILDVKKKRPWTEGPDEGTPPLLVLADFPLTIVGDTLTLPVTVPCAAWRWWEDVWAQLDSPPASDPPTPDEPSAR